MSDSADQLTQLLHAAAAGDRDASARILPLVYEELRRMAHARMGAMARGAAGQTLQPTALVHEAYLKLVRPAASRGDAAGAEPAVGAWEGRAHFFGAASRAMREILVDRARSRDRLKRGGDRQRVEFDQALTLGATPDDDPVDLVALDAALTRLAEHDARAAEVVNLRYFGGLEIEEAARALGISTATANRDWRYAKAFLAAELQAAQDP